MIRATIDTNVLVSALMYPRGKPYQLLQMALAGDINLTVFQAIVNEVGEVLRRKLGATQDFIDESRQVIGGYLVDSGLDSALDSAFGFSAATGSAWSGF